MLVHENIQYVPYVLLAFAAALVASKIYTVLTHPLSHIPGPSIAKWTDLKLKKEVLTGERPHYVHSLHEKYGPVVRIATNEISVADISASRMIYKIGSRFYKTSWYDAFTGFTPKKSLFAMMNPRDHMQHRQNVSWFFSEKYVAELEPYIAKNVRQAVDRMREQMDKDGFMDVFKWWFFMATDVIGEASFGESFQMLESGKPNQYIKDLEIVGSVGILRAEFPTIVRLLAYIPFGRPNEIGKCITRLVTYGQASVNRYWKALNANPDDVKPTLLTKEYGMVENGTLTADQLVRDATGYLVAGTDTTSNALTYMIWEMMQHPDIEQKLAREVAALPDDFTDVELRALPYLDGVINETLRLHSSVSSGLPRLAPQGGVDFCGSYIPQDTVVSVQAYTMHRDGSVWKDPLRFDPSRWANVTKDMKDHFLPFGGGNRICIGMHFAKLEIRHALANFYRTFPEGVRVSKALNFSEEEMQTKSYFLAGPKGCRCMVERRDEVSKEVSS